MRLLPDPGSGDRVVGYRDVFTGRLSAVRRPRRGNRGAFALGGSTVHERWTDHTDLGPYQTLKKSCATRRRLTLGRVHPSVGGHPGRVAPYWGAQGTLAPWISTLAAIAPG